MKKRVVQRQIDDAIIALLESNVGSGLPLEGVASVKRYNRFRDFDLPLVALIPGTITSIDETQGMQMEYEYDISIFAYVEDIDVDDNGYDLAVEKAATLADNAGEIITTSNLCESVEAVIRVFEVDYNGEATELSVITGNRVAEVQLKVHFYRNIDY